MVLEEVPKDFSCQFHPVPDYLANNVILRTESQVSPVTHSFVLIDHLHRERGHTYIHNLISGFS